MVKYEVPLDVPTIVADIGARSTSLVASDGKRYWVRTINQGGESLTNAIHFLFQSKNISRDEAERIKVQVSRVQRRDELSERMMPAVRAYVGELRNAVQHLGTEHGVTFMRMLMLGGASSMYGLQRLLTEELNMSVSIPAGLGTIECASDQKARYVNERLPELAVAIGLGLQGLGRQATRVNMVSATLARRKKETMVRRSSFVGVAAAVLLVAVFSLFTAWRAHVYQSGIDQLRNILGPVSDQSRLATEYASPSPAERQLNLLAGMAEEQDVWRQVMGKFARMLPENQKPGFPLQDKVWLIKLSIRAMPNAPGVYECEAEGGCTLRTDRRNTEYASRVMLVPLREDDSGLFRNVSSDFTASRRSPTLSLAGGQGQDRYFVFRFRFEVVARKGGAQ